MLSNFMILKEIKRKVLEGKKDFIIYPFGENGLKIKNFLNEYFAIKPVFIVDNEWANINSDFITINQLKEKYDDSMCILLSVENAELNMQMQNELLEFADSTHIINFKAEEQKQDIEKEYTLLEYIITKAEEGKEEAASLVETSYVNKKVRRIYSKREIDKMKRLCYRFVRVQMEKEASSIESIENADAAVLFFAPLFESYWTNMQPLFKEYINRGQQCVVMFETLEDFWWTGENVDRILSVMREIKKMGGKCVLYDDCINLDIKFKMCFFCSEYSTYKPEKLRQFSDKIISVQTSGIYKHIYKGQIELDVLYHELDCVDYYICSDYMYEWINRNNDAYKNKMKILGYPKMDTLYNGLKGKSDIPAEWKDKMAGKKVILITIENPDEFVDVFRKYPQVCFIWRPDPEFLKTHSCNEKIEKLKENIENLIIDENRKYIDSFKSSDAMIGMAIFCVPVNYIFTGKPLLLLDGELNMYKRSIALEYKDEAWYKAGYIAADVTEIENFIHMIVEDNNDFMKEKAVYIEKMNQKFDGNVCKNIYHFFESIVQ